ncbi:MAG TPA: threonine synthase [Kofleriaceae bacterium]|nr:threonine synthase [Kofleriaceae bacterium]
MNERQSPTAGAAADIGAGAATGLRCRECRHPYEHGAVHVCELCFGPLEVDYDYDRIAASIDRATLAARPRTMWRYAELLPLGRPPAVGLAVGGTPLVPAPRLAARLGLGEVWVKNDAVCHPSLSFKDRVVAVAVSKAIELGFDHVACASTGNLANSVAANAAQLGLKATILIPKDLEPAKILATQIYGARVVAIDGTYDDVNRLCAEAADRHRWAFVNVNLRPYYSEGSKSYAFEIADQLGWRTPDHVVAPMAGGSLVTKIGKAWKELTALGLLPERKTPTRIHGAQAAGCAPIVEAVLAGRDLIRPVKEPRTIARSLAIGNPADGYYAVQTISKSGGTGVAASDEEIVSAIRLLAETEGIFTETAGGVTVAAARRLAESGAIGPGESVVLCITGQGLKTTDPLVGELPPPPVIAPRLSELSALASADE